MSLRKIVNTLHLWLGLASGTILLIVAITGCMLAFEDEIRDETEHDLLYVEPAHSIQLGVHAVLNVVHQYKPKAEPTQVRYFGDPDKAVQVFTKDKKIYAVNPYTGKVLGFRDQNKNFMYVVLSLHRTLLLGKTGETIITVNVWIFVIMLLSGFFLWWPKRRKQLRQAITIKKDATRKRRLFDLHSVGGFYAVLPLLIMASMGISMLLGKPKSSGKSRLVAGNSIKQDVYDSAFHKAYHGEPLDVLRIILPKDSSDVITVSIRYKTSSFRKQSDFLFDRYSLALLHTNNWEKKDLPERVFDSDYEIHTGRILGWPGKVIVLLAALIAASLPVTGFLFWRAKNTKARKQIREVK